MPEFAPFRGLRYRPGAAGPMDGLVAPPYDIIAPEERRRLAERSPHNVVHLILPEGPLEGFGSRYRRAADLFGQWRASGVLAAEESPVFYLYEQRFGAAGARHTRRGVIGLLGLEKLGEGRIYGHESTIPGPIADRLELMRSTRANLSQIMMLAADDGGVLAKRLDDLAAGAPPLFEVTGPDGVAESLSAVSAPDDVEAVSGALASDALIIADGHHRYETALRYAEEAASRGEAGGGRMAVTVFSMRDPGLIILPTHRVADAPGNLSPAGLVDALSGTFDAEPVGMDEVVGIASEVEGPPTVGFAAAGLDSPVRLTLADSSAMKAAAPERSPAWRRTDVAVLHELILRPHLDLSPERILRKEGIDFVKDASAAAREALSSAGRWAFVIRATTMDQMRHIAGHGELMPQKSTYFYPKLTTGLVMRAMDI